jgi:hypothetical protein
VDPARSLEPRQEQAEQLVEEAARRSDERARRSVGLRQRSMELGRVCGEPVLPREDAHVDAVTADRPAERRGAPRHEDHHRLVGRELLLELRELDVRRRAQLRETAARRSRAGLELVEGGLRALDRGLRGGVRPVSRLAANELFEPAEQIRRALAAMSRSPRIPAMRSCRPSSRSSPWST